MNKLLRGIVCVVLMLIMGNSFKTVMVEASILGPSDNTFQALVNISVEAGNG